MERYHDLQSTGATSPYAFPMTDTNSLVKIDTAYRYCLIQFVHNGTGNRTMLYNEWCTESTMAKEQFIHFLKYILTWNLRYTLTCQVHVNIQTTKKLASHCMQSKLTAKTLPLPCRYLSNIMLPYTFMCTCTGIHHKYLYMYVSLCVSACVNQATALHSWLRNRCCWWDTLVLAGDSVRDKMVAQCIQNELRSCHEIDRMTESGKSINQ